jgi:hypothetical protein
VARDAVQTVTLLRLTSGGGYEREAQMPLSWLLRRSPDDHLPTIR